MLHGINVHDTPVYSPHALINLEIEHMFGPGEWTISIIME